MKRNKRAYLVSTGRKKDKIKESIERKYNVLFTDEMDESEILIVPIEEKILPVQEEMVRAYRGNGEIVFASERELSGDGYNAALDKALERKERERKFTDDEFEYGMEI